MIFVAFFGIEDKNVHIGVKNNVVCPSCGHLTHLEMYKAYRYLHIFFIPTFRWNRRYYVKTPCCSALYELDMPVGQAFEENPDTEIRPENLHRVYSPFV